MIYLDLGKKKKEISIVHITVINWGVTEANVQGEAPGFTLEYGQEWKEVSVFFM